MAALAAEEDAEKTVQQGQTFTTVQIVQDYMGELKKRLDKNELKDFAVLLKAYRSGLPLPDFAEKLERLMGPNR